MPRFNALQAFFRRQRRPGDIVFAWLFFLIAIFLVSQIGTQSPWKGTRQIFAQPAFWPTVSLVTMLGFAGLHLLSSALSPRIPGRLQELHYWLRAAEYVVWFLVYVWLVPKAGYLPTTMVAAALLAVRAGYRRPRQIIGLVGVGAIIVIVFRGFLQVKMPAGAVYEYLPSSIRVFMMTYL